MPATMRVPDAAGRFGQFGGRYIPETLMRLAGRTCSVRYNDAAADARRFETELNELYKNSRRPAVAALFCQAAD